MNELPFALDKIWKIKNDAAFNALAMRLFRWQSEKNEVYKKYLKQININPEKISTIRQIPFLPVDFFKTHKICTGPTSRVSTFFCSSGTTGKNTSKHYVHDISVYEKSFAKCFEIFYGNIENYCLIALLPSYLERKHSSLVFMTHRLIKKTKNSRCGFYLHNFSELASKLNILEKENHSKTTILLGVSFALLDFAEKFPMKLKNTIIMETGGMKGRKKEIVREELHRKLCDSFDVKTIHSEYGMTELLSQAYSKGNGIFLTPPWMKILIRDINDNFRILKSGQTGGINVIDLANVYSCSFIATQDLGNLHADGSFEALGRFDNSNLRGCNMLYNAINN